MSRSGMQIDLPNNILIPEVRRLTDGGSEVVLMTKGVSMLPFITGGRDSVRLRKTAFGEIEEGDIVLAEVAKEKYVLHRVVGKKDGRLTLRGDGNISGKETCGAEDIIGVVTKIIAPSGKERTPGKARLWRVLGPFPRRCVLAVYRRTILKLKQK